MFPALISSIGIGRAQKHETLDIWREKWQLESYAMQYYAFEDEVRSQARYGGTMVHRPRRDAV